MAHYIMRVWRNWQTHQIQGLAPLRRGGSNPFTRILSAEVVQW
jgi:hypothetical protein